MIDYIGDLSKADAELLSKLASSAKHILEFGAGASTQIFAVYGVNLVHCVEDDPEWEEKTRRNVQRFNAAPVEFHHYDDFNIWIRGEMFDLIFVDGPDELRFDFAAKTWPALEVGGLMCFHDTRRIKPHGKAETSDIENALIIAARFSAEVQKIVFNQADSNITVITKCAPVLLEDWNLIEGRTDEQIGLK